MLLESGFRVYGPWFMFYVLRYRMFGLWFRGKRKGESHTCSSWRNFQYDMEQHSYEKPIKINLSGNEICYTNSLVLLVKNMLCNKLQCHESLDSIFFSYKHLLVVRELPIRHGHEERPPNPQRHEH